MYRLHLARNLRTCGFLLAIAVSLAGVGYVYWANDSGMPETWRTAIEQEVSKQGAHLQIGSLRYRPLQGLIATDVRVFSDAEHSQEISKLERIILDFDKTKLARGILHLNKIQLSDATLELPVDPKDPASGVIRVTEVNGTVLMPGERRLEVRNARGIVAGVQLLVNARMIGYQQNGAKPKDDIDYGKRRALVAKIITELETWQFNRRQPPQIQVNVEGDVNDRSSIRAKLKFKVSDIEKNGHVLDEVTADADMQGDLLTVTSLRAVDPRGVFEGHVDYDIESRGGRFDVSSSLEVPALLTSWLSLPAPKDLKITGRQILEAEGDFNLNEKYQPVFRFTGQARCEGVTLKTMLFDSIEGAFSWRDESLFLRDLKLVRPDGFAEVKAMIDWPIIRLKMHSTLPVPVYRPFFVGQPLEVVLNSFSENEGAAVNVKLEGGCDISNKFAWAYTGSGTVRNVSYKNVPVNLAECRFSLNRDELDFRDGTIVFDYSDYPLRKAFDGPSQGTAKVGQIRYDAGRKIVEIDDIRGAFYAAPMVRIFAPKIADSLEQYRFHRPPDLKADGEVDVTPKGRTQLDVAFSSDSPADYGFLGQSVTLGFPRAKVGIKGEKVSIQDLQVRAFDGPVAGNFKYHGGALLTGDMKWNKLSVAKLAQTYGLEIKGEGDFTGRLDFSITGGKVETMDGNGLMALENAELFSVPLFGPLTPLLTNVLQNENAGQQLAKNAFCTFSIQDGILSSDDFKTSTKSLNFAGIGSLNLMERTIDMTMRVSALGLLKLFAFPLRPISGMFQFRGTGPLKDTKWKSTDYTVPPENDRETLARPPRAKVVVTE